jgi:hypothetical protein
MRSVRRTLAALVLVFGVACQSSGGGSSQSAFCSDVQNAENAPYSNDVYLQMQRDFPYVPGDDGYTAANDAVNSYGPGGDTTKPSVTFLQNASVYLTGWCG